MTQLAGPSARSLLLRMRAGGQVIATGTGFVVDEIGGPHLLTNWHNVAGRRPDNGQPLSSTGAVPDEVEILHHNTQRKGTWIPRVEPLYDADGTPVWREHPTHRSRVDSVALRLTQMDGVGLFSYILRENAMAYGPSDAVSIIGFPFGIQTGGSLPVWVTGFIASEPQIDYNDLPLMLIDSRTRPGQSGSPVIIYRTGGFTTFEDGSSRMFNVPSWRFLGIYSGRINSESDLGLVWKVEAIEEILRAGVAGSPRPGGAAVGP